LNLKRLNANADAAPMITELIATVEEMIKEFLTQDKNGIFGLEKSIL